MNETPNGLLPASIASLGPDASTAPFWEAVKDHRLCFARCTSCGAFHYPALPFCGECLTQDVEWVQSSGDATLYSFTIIRHAVVPELAAYVPYCLAVVDVDDCPGVRMMTNVVGADFDALAVGQKLKVYFHDVNGEVTIPRFTPA